MFEQSKLKVSRADHHIRDLNARIVEFSNRKPYVISIKDQPETGKKFIEVKTTEVMPGDLPLIIGDAFHNLRSSLDILATDITGDPNVHFWIHEERYNLVNALQGAEVKGLSPLISEIIVDKIKPYKTGNYPLWAMNQFNRLDKHRLIIPVMNFMNFADVGAKDKQTGEIFKLGIGIGGSGQQKAWIPLPHGDFEIANNENTAIDIVFARNDFFSGGGVIETLHEMSRVTLTAINVLEDFFLREAA